MAYGQIDWGAYSQSFPDGATDNPATVALMLAIPSANNSFWTTHETCPQLNKLVSDSSFRQVRPADLVARTTFDTARAHFFLHGVRPNNAAAYEFRVLDYPTNRVVVPWHQIEQFTEASLMQQSGLPQMGYLGGFRAPLGHTLIVDVRKANTGQIVATSLIAWVAIRPVITNVYTSDNLDDFLKKLQYPWARETKRHPAEPLTLPSTNTNLILVLNAAIYHKEQVQYELVRNEDVVIPWTNNAYDNSFVWLKDYKPGTYQVRLRYTAQPQHVTTYRFVVEPAWYESRGFKIMVGIVVAACLGAIFFLLLYVQQKQKSRQELAKKTKLQLELKAIYAQLNPHFVFNALNSIQGLINKQDIQGANNYLSDFARLLRESLTNSNKDEISIHEELQGLDTYLKLERLRFGFEYQISLADSINPYDGSIPALLLQPLVENAVKHGVSALGDAGRIQVRFDRINDTMLVQISDNGNGFRGDAPTGGFGLKLTRDRINLLTELNREQPIELEIAPPSPTGATLTLRFNHWFA
ncbi:Inner membrane protein yehU [Fibrella aestuarina BUZ 2]|uniref:Inner membrane protein yehU n=2 Tax=Fibrella TaxID=861914 RepID=I0K9P8_9BACT|nr:Inner membrane protein yehU [Fibrella aestuarina BUZ 2]